MRQLNVKFLLYLIGAVVLVSAGAFVVHRAQSWRIANALLRQADRAEAQGQLDHKVKYLSRYLEFQPRDHARRADLGRTLAHPDLAVSYRARERALFVLEQVLIAEPDHHDLRLSLARIALELRRQELAGEHLTFLKERTPQDPELQKLFGEWYEARSDFAAAAAAYRTVVQQAPQDVDAPVRLAYLLRRRLNQGDGSEQAKEADAAIDQFVARNPDSSKALLARWQYRKEFHGLKEPARLDEAGQDVVRALALAPEEAGVRRAAAELAQGKGDLVQARAHLQAGVTLHPRDGSLYQALARLEVEAKERTRAIDYLRQGIKAVAPGQAKADLLWMLSNLLIDEGALADADSVLGQMRRAGATPAAAEFLGARILVKKGQWAEAARVLERTRPLVESTPELARQLDLLLGQCYEQLDEPDRRLAVFQRLVGRDPDSLAARQSLAASLWLKGRVDEALEQHRAIMRLPEAPANGWTQVARLLILRNLQRGLRDWKEAEEAITRAEKVQPDALEVTVLRSELLVAQDRFKEAHQLLAQAQDRNPGRVEGWVALAGLLQRQEKIEEARQVLEEARRRCGDSADLRLGEARLWSALPRDEAKQRLPGLARDLERFSPEDQSRLFYGLVEGYCRLSAFKEATQLWGRLATQPRFANDLRVQQLWFDLALQADDEETLGQVLAAIERIEGGQGPLWHYGEGLRLIRLARKGNEELLDQACARLDVVANRRPSWPAVLVARASVEALKKNYPLAVVNYRRAIELGDRSPQVVRELVRVLHRCQRTAEAYEEIRRLNRQTLTPDLQRLAADISLRNQDPANAARLALNAVSAASKNYQDYLWQGQMLAASGQNLKEAEDALQRAVELGGEVPETWVALARLLVTANRAKEAEEIVRQAQGKLAADQVALGLAQCQEVLGRLDEARKHYQAALSARPDDPTVVRSVTAFHIREGRLADAEPLLRRFIDRKLQVTDSDAAWARRSLAQAIANHDDYRRYPEALALVGLRLENESKVIETARPPEAEWAEEQRCRARVLVTASRKALRQHAIRLLEELIRRQGTTPDDQFLLAQLYEADGVWTKARELFSALAAPRDANALVLAHAARSSLRHREHDPARRYLERLEQAEKVQNAERGSLGSMELTALYLEATGDRVGAVGVLEEQAKRQGAPPEAVLPLAACLARGGRLNEALDRCEEALRACPPEAVGGTAAAALRTATPRREHIDRVERMLLDLIAKNPRSPVLWLHLADVYDVKEQRDKAEAAYRQILKLDEKSVVALNNLAWLLSQKPGGAAEAQTLIARAIELVGPRAELLDTRALTYLAAGRTDLAVADLEQSSAEVPNGARFFHLARAHETARNREAAAAFLRKAEKELGPRGEQLHPLERGAYLKMLAELK